MKTLIFLATIITSWHSNAATATDVLEFVQNDEAVLEVLEEVKNDPMAKAWGGMQVSEPEIAQIATEYSDGNPLGGNGHTTNYLVKFKYSVNMDWNGYSDTVMVFVTEWNYTALKFPGQKRLVANTMKLGIPASSGIRIDKIYKSAKEVK